MTVEQKLMRYKIGWEEANGIFDFPSYPKREVDATRYEIESDGRFTFYRGDAPVGTYPRNMTVYRAEPIDPA